MGLLIGPIMAEEGPLEESLLVNYSVTKVEDDDFYDVASIIWFWRIPLSYSDEQNWQVLSPPSMGKLIRHQYLSAVSDQSTSHRSVLGAITFKRQILLLN